MDRNCARFGSVVEALPNKLPPIRPLWQRATAVFLIAALGIAPVKVSIDQVFGLHLGTSQAIAAPIVDPYAPVFFRPTITQTTTGVPVVNITAPNNAGISHNRYQQFNVDSVGLILNNSLSGGGTLLGGAVGANASLAGRSASLILNEVSGAGGGGASVLNGILEVFGSPARVIIANPNGMTCSGCGFINTPRITLTTGVPQFLSAGGSAAAFEQSSALAFDVRSGRVWVDASGLEGTAGRIDIVAETVVLDGPLRANLGPAGRIDLVAGRQRVAETADAEFVVSGNGATNTAQSIRVGDPRSSAYAIDGSAFGAMTAGQIRIIATPQGMGVRADAALAASTGNLTISSSGEVRVGSAFANQDLMLHSAGDLAAHGEVYAARDVALRAGGGLRAADGTSAGQHLDLQASGDVMLGGSTLAQGSVSVVSRLGNVAAAGDIGARTLDVDARSDVDLLGGVAVSGDATIGAGASLALKQSVAVGGDLRLTAGGDISSDAETRVVGHLQAASGRDGRFIGALSVGGNLGVDAAQNVSFGDTVEIAGDGDLRARAGSLTSARTLAAGGSARLEASNALSLGDSLQSAGTLSLRSGGATAIHGGILAGGDTVLSGGTVRVDGGVTVIGNGDFRSHSGGMTFGTDVQAAGDLTLMSAGDLGASGSVLAVGAIDLSTDGAANLAAGVVAGKAAIIRAREHLSMGAVTAVDNATIESGASISVADKLRAGGDISISAATSLTLADEIIAPGRIELRARSGDLDAFGVIYAGADASLSAAGNMRLGGTFSAQRFANMTAGGDLTMTGPVAADRLTAGAGGVLDAGGRLASAGDMRLEGSDVRTSGLLVGGGLAVDAARDAVLAGDTVVQGDARLGAGARLAHGGLTSIGGSVAASAAELANSGSLYASGNVALSGGSVTNRGTVYGSDARVTAALFDNAGGSLLAGNDLAVDVAGLSSNANGLLGAQRDASITATGVLANGGTILAGRDLHLSAPNSAFDPATAGDIAAGNLLGISARSVSNAGEWMPRALRLTVAAQTDFSNSGTIALAGDVGIAAGGDIGNSGRLAAGGTLALSGTNVTNSGTVLADRNLDLAGNVINRGSLFSLGNVTVTGSGFDNRGATTQADGDLVVRVSGPLVNVGGDLIALGNAELRSDTIDNDRAEPTDVTTVTRGHNPEILNTVVLLPASTVTVSVPCGESTCLMSSVVPPLTVGSLGPSYATNTVSVEREVLPLTSTTLALPQTVREERTQNHGRESRILVAGDATLAAQGAASNRGGLIESGGSLSITAQSVNSGRSTTLVNGATESTDAADLSRFIAELNAARGAGTLVWTCSGEAGCGMEPVASYGTNPVTTSSIVRTPGLAGNILAGADLRLSLAGDFANSGVTAAARDLVLSGASLANQPGATLLAGQDLALALSGGAGNAESAQIVSGRDMRLSVAGAVTNTAATIESGRDLAIDAGSIANAAAGRSSRQFVYYVNTTADYQHDKYLTLEAFTTGIEGLIGDAATRNKLIYGESLADYKNYEGSHRIRLNGPTDFYIDSGQTEPRFTLTLTGYEHPAIVSAGRNGTLNIGGAVDNVASAISAGNDLTVRAASVSNAAAANVAFLRITAGEWSEYTAFTPAASALQAAGTLSISAGGQVINSGNVLGQRVQVTGSSIVNGITSTIPNIGSTTPSAVISLAGPDFGNGFDAARGSLSALSGTTAGVPGDPPGGSDLGTDLVSTRGVPGSVRTDRTIPGVGLASGTYGVWGLEITADGPSSTTPTASDSFRYLHTNPAAGFLAPLTPEYLLGLLPKNLVEGRNLFFYADPYVEQQLLRRAALRETGQAYFLNGLAFDDQYQASIDTQQRALLYEAAARFAAENGLTLGQALSPQLQAKLDAPLLWYVEQQVPDPDCSALTADCSGRFVTALVPTVYLPQLYREGSRNLAGGMIRGDDVTLQAAGTINNTGYLLAGNTLSVTARDFLNQKRQADFGKEFQAISGGWIDITGTRPVSEGGVVAAADLQLNAERIESISGEFQVLGRDAADTQARSAAYLAGLRTVYGPQFQESVAKANLHYEVHQENDPFEQIAVAALGIGLSLWLGPQMSALVGEAFGATAGAFMGAAGTVQGVAVSAGVGNMVVAGTLTGMATSSATQLVATGSIDLGDAFQSGLTSGLTAGLTRGIGEAIGNETLLGGKLVDAGNGQTVVVATDGATSLADKLVGYTVRAATGAGVNQLVYGSNAGDAGTDFVNSLVSSASADAANWIGGNIDRQTNPLGNIGAHALVGCAAAAASGNDCGAGALGAATAASLNPVLDQITSITDQATRDAQLAALSTAAAGFLAHATGNDIQTAIGAGQNETLNNYLTRSQKTQMLREVANCGDLLCKAGAYTKYGVVSAKQDVALLQGMGVGARRPGIRDRRWHRPGGHGHSGHREGAA